MYDVVVVGDTAWDTIIRIEQELKYNADTPASIYQGPGGQSFNMAIASARQGASTALVTQVGTDSISRSLTRSIHNIGVHLVSLTRVDPLTHVVSVVRRDGERALMTYPGLGPLGVPGKRSGESALNFWIPSGSASGCRTTLSVVELGTCTPHDGSAGSRQCVFERSIGALSSVRRLSFG